MVESLIPLLYLTPYLAMLAALLAVPAVSIPTSGEG